MKNKVFEKWITRSTNYNYALGMTDAKRVESKKIKVNDEVKSVSLRNEYHTNPV